MRSLSTNENLNEPQPLPENWEGIFGLSGFKDRVGNLAWLGNPAYMDAGWFDTGIPLPPKPVAIEDSPELIAKKTARAMLTESDWTMMPDVPMNKGNRMRWEEYRKALREIKLQPGYPTDIKWPPKPE